MTHAADVNGHTVGQRIGYTRVSTVRRADVFVDVGRRHQLRVVRPLVEEVP
jgi:hypothetical protein